MRLKKILPLRQFQVRSNSKFLFVYVKSVRSIPYLDRVVRRPTVLHSWDAPLFVAHVTS